VFIWQKTISFITLEPLVARVNLPLMSVSNINKRNQGVIIRNAIEIIADKEYTFSGFQNRDEVYNVLETLWRYRNKRGPLIINGYPIQQVLGSIKFKQEQADFKRRFSFENELLFTCTWATHTTHSHSHSLTHSRMHLVDDCVDFTCSSKSTLSFRPGKLYISQSYICFYYRNFGTRNQETIEFLQVQSILPSVNMVGQEAIDITTSKQTYSFTGFADQELAYATLQYQWRLALDVRTRPEPVVMELLTNLCCCCCTITA